MQQALPEKYNQMSDKQASQRITAIKAQLGRQLCVLAHHYQSDEIIRHSDFIGDSLKLSQQASAHEDADYIVFCGVHFMAETADILSQPNQAVCLPNMQAGCAMADMADADAVAAAIEELSAMTAAKIIPIAYVNSTAAVKAVVARAGGACCTSSNVRGIFEWALAGGENSGAGNTADREIKILAIPDQHLARNTAIAMGYSPHACRVYDPSLRAGGLSDADVAAAKFILWKGHCHVHQMFTPSHIAAARHRWPGAIVLVHPECPHEVVALADGAGSTEQIIQAVESAAPGTIWAIGTESHMVHRLAAHCPNKTVHVLSGTNPICPQMGRIDTRHLLWTMENLIEGRIVNRITVAPDLAADAKISLQRMLAAKPAAGVVFRK